MLYLLGGIAVVLGVLVVANHRARLRHTPAQAANLIEGHLAGKTSAAEWDEFTCVRASNAAVETARIECVEVEQRHSSEEHPPTYLDRHGAERLGQIVKRLRRDAA